MGTGELSELDDPGGGSTRDMGVDGGAIGRRRRAAQVAGSDEYQAKRREVIQAAATVFQEKGYQTATLHDVASVLDTDRATLYYYVSGKEELLREAVFAYMLEIVEDIRRIANSEVPTPEKLRDLITMLMTAYEAHYPHPYVFIQEKLDEAFRLDTEWAHQLVGIMTELQSQLVAIIEQGARDGTLRADLPSDLVANAMFGMINWTHRWFKPSTSRHAGSEIGACFAEIFLKGMVSDGRSPTECPGYPG